MQSNKQQQRKTINLKAEWKVQKNGYQDDLSTNDFPNSFQHFLHHWIVFTGKSLNCEIFQSLSIRAKLTSGKNQFNVTLLFKHLFMLVWQYAIAIALPDRLLFTVSIDSFVHIVRFCFLDFFSVVLSLSLYFFWSSMDVCLFISLHSNKTFNGKYFAFNLCCCFFCRRRHRYSHHCARRSHIKVEEIK